jgi:hypothetical protein
MDKTGQEVKGDSMRKLLVLLAIVAAFLGVMSPAMAASNTKHTPPPIGALKIVLRADLGLGATSEGVNSVMLDTTAYSTFNQLTLTNGNFIYRNQSGNCVHGTDTNTVTISTACGSGNTASQWNTVSNGGANVLKNVAYGKYMYSDSGNCNQANVDAVLAPLGTSGLCIYEVTGT